MSLVRLSLLIRTITPTMMEAYGPKNRCFLQRSAISCINGVSAGGFILRVQNEVVKASLAVSYNVYKVA